MPYHDILEEMASFTWWPFACSFHVRLWKVKSSNFYPGSICFCSCIYCHNGAKWQQDYKTGRSKPTMMLCFVWNRETSNQSCINSQITFSAIWKRWALNVEQQKIRPKWFSVRVSGYQCLTSESHFHIPANFYLPQPSALYIFQPLLYFCTIIIKDSFLEMVKSRPKNQRQLVIPGSYTMHLILRLRHFMIIEANPSAWRHCFLQVIASNALRDPFHLKWNVTFACNDSILACPLTSPYHTNTLSQCPISHLCCPLIMSCVLLRLYPRDCWGDQRTELYLNWKKT